MADVKVGDFVELSEKADADGLGFRDKGPWEVASVDRYGVVAILRVSKRTGRRWKDYIHKTFLRVVKGKE